MQEGTMKKVLLHSQGDSTNMGMLGSIGNFAHAYKLGNKYLVSLHACRRCRSISYGRERADAAMTLPIRAKGRLQLAATSQGLSLHGNADGKWSVARAAKH
jgi:hypothetical protein